MSFPNFSKSDRGKGPQPTVPPAHGTYALERITSPLRLNRKQLLANVLLTFRSRTVGQTVGSDQAVGNRTANRSRGGSDVPIHARVRQRSRPQGRKGVRQGAADSVDRVEEAFGPLQTIEDAQRRLERIGVWAAAGLLGGSVAGASVRSVEVWLRASESKLTQHVVEELAGELKRLKAELGGAVRVTP